MNHCGSAVNGSGARPLLTVFAPIAGRKSGWPCQDEIWSNGALELRRGGCLEIRLELGSTAALEKRESWRAVLRDWSQDGAKVDDSFNAKNTGCHLVISSMWSVLSRGLCFCRGEGNKCSDSGCE